MYKPNTTDGIIYLWMCSHGSQGYKSQKKQEIGNHSVLELSY